MSVLNDIFSNVIYSEVKHLFDEMESVFVSLTENQRLTQFKKVAELYSKDVSKEVMTWRHLFEEGLKKEYRVNPDNQGVSLNIKKLYN